MLTGTRYLEAIEQDGKQNYMGKIKWQSGRSSLEKLALLENFLDALGQSVCIKDQEGIYVYANKHYCERAGALDRAIEGKRDEAYWEEKQCKEFGEYDH